MYRHGAIAVATICATACGRTAIDARAPEVSVDAAVDATHAEARADGPGTSSDGADASCGMFTWPFERVSPRILIVFDRSVAGAVPPWRDELARFIPVVSANDVAIDWGLYTFPDTGATCGPDLIKSMVDVPVAATNASAVTTALAATVPVRNGTPTAAAIDVAAAYVRGLPDGDAPRFVMLVSDGAPTCAGGNGAPSSDDPARAQADALDAVRAAAADGVPTLVVGLAPPEAADVAALNALAMAGGYARAQSQLRFYTPATVGELFTGVSNTSCTIPLQPSPPAPDAVTITFDGEPVRRDPTHSNGWDYPDVSATGVTFYGSWCERLMTERSGQVTATYGCP